MTWKECENSRLSTEERSILALLSGNLKALLPSCQTWEDHLWAYLRVMIDQTVEKELRRCVNYKRQLEVLPDEYWNQLLTVDTIFSRLAASRDKTVIAQGRDQYRFQIYNINFDFRVLFRLNIIELFISFVGQLSEKHFPRRRSNRRNSNA